MTSILSMNTVLAGKSIPADTDSAILQSRSVKKEAIDRLGLGEMLA